MKKYFSLFTLSILFILLSITNANAENLITNEKEEIVEIEIYDENDDLVKVIKQAAEPQSENHTSLSSWRWYDFGETIFSNYVWIKNGDAFYMPDLVDAEVPKAFPGPWGVKVYTAGGTYKGKAMVRDIFNW